MSTPTMPPPPRPPITSPSPSRLVSALFVVTLITSAPSIIVVMFIVRIVTVVFAVVARLGFLPAPF